MQKKGPIIGPMDHCLRRMHDAANAGIRVKLEPKDEPPEEEEEEEAQDEPQQQAQQPQQGQQRQDSLEQQ